MPRSLTTTLLVIGTVIAFTGGIGFALIPFVLALVNEVITLIVMGSATDSAASVASQESDDL